MTAAEISRIIDDLAEKKLSTAHLTMPAPNFKRHYPMRVRTPFGLCRWYPSSDPKRIIIYPSVGQLKKFLIKLTEQLENDGALKNQDEA
jgi:hypothetical protein